MNMNIELPTLNKHFSLKPQNYNISQNSKIVNYSPFYINEVDVSSIIEEIPYYPIFYSIMKECEPLNITELHDDFIKKIDISHDNAYFIFKYENKNAINFTDYIYNFNNITQLIRGIIDSFSHILQGLCLLNKNNICYFNIMPKNIIFLENYREKPLIKNFQYSLILNKLSLNYISPFLYKLEDYTYKPLEIHLLYYLIKHDMNSISYSFIEEFCKHFVENLHILNLFSENYKKSYREQCVEMMKKYINRPKQYIINDILERNDKWDVYSITILYIHIFCCVSRIFSLKGTFISKIIIELSKNIHPDSKNRMSLERTYEVFNILISEQDNWNFVNKLDNNKLDKLFYDLSN